MLQAGFRVFFFSGFFVGRYKSNKPDVKIGVKGVVTRGRFFQAIIFVIFGCRKKKKLCIFARGCIISYIIKCHPEYFGNKRNNFGGKMEMEMKVFQRDEKFWILR